MMEQKPPRTFYDRFNEILERYAPAGLYRRAMAILIVPVVLLQLIMASVILLRYWDNVTVILANTLVDQLGFVITSYEKSDKSEAALIALQKMAREQLHMDFEYAHGKQLPATFNPNLSYLDARIQQFLNISDQRKYSVQSAVPGDKVEVQVEVDKDLIFLARIDANHARAIDAPFLILFMVFSTTALMAIAVIFLRNQINPILDLTRAAQEFGKGRELAAFHPQGATEVRLAGEAFIDMKRRIARHVDQRTTMLAGVSHDLRTILTRFKLGLAVLGENAKTKPLLDDTAEMQHMLEDYMAFVRGDGGEQITSVAVVDAVQSVIQSFAREGTKVQLMQLPDLKLQLKPNAFRRLLTNVVGNAVRHGKLVEISGEARDEWLWLYVDDDGPGIPAHLRDDAFRPFVRLDQARNLNKSGTGLGLAIALDIAMAHGGDIQLSDSPLRGLRAAIRIPV